jgi:exodeoxyribonuclease X
VETATIIDTETARIKDPVPVELALISVDGNPSDFEMQGHRTYLMRFNPECPIDFGAIAAHNILPEELETEQKWSDFHFSLNSQYIVGHNVDFDLEVVYGGKDKIPEGLRRICTLALSRWAYPDIDSHKLTAMVYVIFGQTQRARTFNEGAHGALPDALNCGRLVHSIAQHFGITSWEELWKLSELARIPTRMSFGKYGPKDGQPGTLIAEMVKDRGYVQWLLKLPDLDPYLRKAIT